MINWGIIGPGEIARVFCNALRFSKTGQASAVASRDRAKARDFAKLFSIPTVHDSYEELFVDGSVDVVYIATINAAHLSWVNKAAKAGKHLLVEKPMGINHREVAAMVEAARSNDVFLMEAFMYRCHPQMQRVAALVQDGAIGDVRVIQSNFGYKAGWDPKAAVFDRDLGGGGIMDVGCYPASAARFVAGAAIGKAFLDPIEVKAAGFIGDSGVDYHASAVLKFESGTVAQLSAAINCDLPSVLTVFGTEGVLTVPNPWLPSTPCRWASQPLPLNTTFPGSEIHIQKGSQRQVIDVEVDRDLFTYEADTVADHLSSGQAPDVSWSDSEGNAQLLERWRAQIGLRFPQDV